MKQALSLLKKASGNKVLHYVLSRYATYIIQFINSLFIAIYIGPFYLGIWGFINLIIQYLAQLNFGIAHSVNAIAAIHKNKEEYVRKIAGTAISMLIFLSIIIALFFVASIFFEFKIGDKYNFSNYAPFVFFIAVLGYFNTLLSNIFRVYGKLFEIAFSQSALPILMTITIFIFKAENLLWALVITNCIAVLLSILLFIYKTPIKIRPQFDWHLVKIIQHRGWHLFIYNTSFYLIIICTRSFVSAYYGVSEFGYFTFSFSMANTILLLFDSFSFLIFPKLLNRFASNTTEQTALLLKKVRAVYITISHAVIHFAVFLFPFFLLFIPKYESASDAFKMIALTIVLTTNAFGYQGLLIAKGKEKLLGILSISALCINIIAALILVLFISVPYWLVIISTMFTYVFYIFLLGRFGRKKLNLETRFISILKDVFPIRLFIPYLVSFSLIIFSANSIYFIIPVLLFLSMNYKVLLNIKVIIKEVLVSPEMINI